MSNADSTNGGPGSEPGSLTVFAVKLDRLSFHPVLERVGMLDSTIAFLSRRAKATGKDREKHRERATECQETLDALTDSIRSHGIREPLKVCPGGLDLLVVDGRHRVLAARAAGLKTVPAILVKPSEAATIARDSILRRPLSKGAIAYTAALIGDYESGSHGGDRRSSALSALENDAASVARAYGVSERYLQAAGMILRTFEKHPKLRREFEQSIWAGYGLGGIWAGIQAKLAGEKAASRDRRQPRFHERLERQCQTFLRLFDTWEEATDDDQELAVDHLAQFLDALPGDLAKTLKERLA